MIKSGDDGTLVPLETLFPTSNLGKQSENHSPELLSDMTCSSQHVYTNQQIWRSEMMLRSHHHRYIQPDFLHHWIKSPVG